MAKKKTFAELMAEAALQGMPEDKTTADLLNVPLSRGAILPLTEYLDRAEFDLSSGLPGAFADAVTAPARAARGEISEDQQIPEAFNFAGSLTLGSLLAPRPTGSVGMGGRAAKALEAQQPQGIRAFHGSPHDFDRFSMDAIGTGEGAQAYGHGLYFAEAEDVAKTYREPVTGGWGGERFTVNGLDEDHLPIHVRQAVASVGREAGDGPLDAAAIEKALQGARAAVERYEASKDPSVIRNNLSHARDTLRGLEEIKGAKLGRKQIGHMYEVNIKADPQDFLDWDKPLSQQSEKVKDAAHSALMAKGIGRTLADYIVNSDKPARDAITTIARGSYDTRLNMPDGSMAAQASQSLREAGIPGIRYLDQMSRGEGKGSSNYVVFDDAIIDIVRKYGIAGLALLQAAGYGTNEGEETQ